MPPTPPTSAGDARSGRRRLHMAVRRIWPWLAGAVITSIICEILAALLPALLQQIIDRGVGSSTQQATRLGLQYIALALGIVLFSWLTMRFIWRTAAQFEQGLRQDYFEATSLQPATMQPRTNVPQEVSRLNNNVPDLEMEWLSAIRSLLIYIPVLILTAVLIGRVLDPRFAFLLLLGSAITVFAPRQIRKRLSARRLEHLEALEEYSRTVSELLMAHTRITRATRGAFLRRHAESAGATALARQRFGDAKTNNLVLNQLLTTAMSLATLVWALLETRAGTMTTGQFVASLTYATTLIEPIAEIANNLTSLKSMEAARQDIEHRLAWLDVPTDAVAGVPGGGSADVRVEGARVCPDTPYEHVYSLAVPTGQHVLLRGGPGTGKSLLLAALDRTAPCEGIIMLNGTPLASLERDSVFHLEQTPPVFSANFQDNVTIFGSYPYELDRIQALAACFVGHERVLAATDCTTLSGGEMQFMQACRAVCANAPLTLLDEPFSAIAGDGEKYLLATLLENLSGTVLCTSHSHPDIDALFDIVVPIYQWSHTA